MPSKKFQDFTIQRLRIFEALSDTWATVADIRDATLAESRTVRLALSHLEELGIVERMATHPAPRFRRVTPPPPSAQPFLDAILAAAENSPGTRAYARAKIVGAR